MIVGDFTEDYEVMVPFQALTMVGHNVHTVCPGKKSGEQIATAIHDFEKGLQTYLERRGHNFTLNYDFDQINLSDYHGLILPGGRGSEYLRLNDRVIEITEYFLKNNLPLGAICHGIQILTPCSLIKGRKVTCYPTCQTEVKLSGGIFEEKDYGDVTVDGNLITAVAWPGHPKWLSEFLKVLGTSFVSN